MAASDDEPISPTAHPNRSLLVGTAMGLFAAVVYTAANLFLRRAARPGDLDWALLVTAAKALPAATLAWVLIGLRAWQGRPALPPRRVIPLLLAAGLMMQFGGNLMFQYALSLGGLALTVAINFAALISCGAILGRLVLAEPIRPVALLAMSLLISSIFLLSFGAGAATNSVLPGSASGWQIAAAIGAACCAGTAYGANSVIIRRTLGQQVSLPATIVLLSSTGVVGHGLLSLMRLGPAEIATATPVEIRSMLLAGLCNAVAFFSVTGALQRIPVVRVNMLNASQVAMAATAGVLIFEEPATTWLLFGTALTVAGLLILGTSRDHAAAPISELAELEGETPQLSELPAR